MKKLFVIVTLALLMLSCATREISRVSADKQTDFSGYWNDTDSRLVASAMISQALSAAWIDNFATDNSGEKPTLIVGNIGLKNSTEHVNTMAFIKDIQKELINSGRVKFVASSSERGEIRTERSQQQTHASMETTKSMAAETGADFMLKGEISVIMDEYKNKEAKFYQIDLNLINIQSNEISWVGSKKIKKLIGKNTRKW